MGRKKKEKFFRIHQKKEIILSKLFILFSVENSLYFLNACLSIGIRGTLRELDSLSFLLILL